MYKHEKKSGRYRLTPLVLVAAMVSTLLIPAAANNGSATEILRFEKENPVASITVELGTEKDQLPLPQTLSAVIILKDSESEPQAEDQTASAQGAESVEAALPAEETQPAETPVPEETPAPVETPAPSAPQESAEPSQPVRHTVREETVDIPVTWDDGGSYDAGKAGVYTFTANIGDYVFAGALPTLTVEVRSPAAGKVIFAGMDTPLEMYKKALTSEEKEAFLLGSVYAYGEDDPTVRYSVAVKDDGGFDPEKEGEYTITLAAMSDGTELAETTRLVTVHGEDTFLLCSCGAGDHADSHRSDCTILTIPQVVEVYEAKAEGAQGDELPDSVEVPNSVLNEISEQNRAAKAAPSINGPESNPGNNTENSKENGTENSAENGRVSPMRAVVQSAPQNSVIKADSAVLQAGGGAVMLLAASGGEATTEIVVPRGVVYLSPSPAAGNAAGTYKWYDTVAAAQAAMNSATTDYTMIIAKNGYALTAAECNMTGLAGRAKSLAISTSWKDPAGADTLWDRNPATWVPGTTSLGYQGSPSDAGTVTLGADLQLGVPTTFRNMVFGTQRSIQAHANKLVMGEGITMSDSSLYLNLWGDSITAPYTNDKAKSIEVFSGKYALICGGGSNYPMGMHGNKNVSIYGGDISASTGGTSNSENVNGAVYCDAIDDDTGANVSTSTGQNTLLVQPLEGMAFTAPAAISITRWSAGGSPDPAEYDHLTVDTRYYNAPVDLSNTAVAGASSAANGDFARKNVVVDIYAPDATIKSVTARNLISNYNVFPSTINIHDAKYIGLVQGADNNNMLDRSVTKDAIINLYGDITIGTLQWYTDCTLGENANVIIQTKHQPGIRQDGSPYGTSGTWPVRDNRYNGQTIQNLYLGKNSKFTVMAAYMTGSDQTNMLGNIYTAENGQLILTSKGAPGTGGSEAAVLNGNIYIRNGQPIRLGLSSASYPNLSSYCMMYSGDRQFDTVFSPLGSYFTAAETGYSVSTVPNYLVLNNSETNYYEVSVAGGNPATAKYQTLQQVALAINQGSGYAGKIVKIRLLNNRQDEAGWLSVITNCAGIILTGWKDDFGYNIKGDGQQTSGETTSDNDAGDGSAATYKNTNPPGTYGFTTSSDANTTTYMRLNMRVPLTMRNLGLIQAKNTYLNGHGNRIQIGPGLVHKTNGNSFQVFGNEQFDGADDGTSGSTNSFSSANRGADVTIYNGDYTSLCALGRFNASSCTWSPGSTGTTNISLRMYGGNKLTNSASAALSSVSVTNLAGGATTNTATVNGDVELTLAPTDGYDFSFPQNVDIVAGKDGVATYNGNLKLNVRIPANRGSFSISNVSPVYSSANVGCPAGKTWTTTVDAPTSSFNRVSAANSSTSEISGLGTRIANIISAKSISSIWGTNFVTPYASLTSQTSIINIGGTKGTDQADRTYNIGAIQNWNALNIQNGAVVNVTGDNGLANVRSGNSTSYTAAQDALNTMNIKEYARLNLTGSGGNRMYGVNNIESSDGTGTLAVYPNGTTDAGLRVKGANLMPGGNKLTLDLVSGVTAVPNMKLLTFVKAADGKVPMGWSDADATGNGGTPLLKGSAFSAFKYGIISDYPSTGFTNNTLILAADEGAVRLYAATSNGGRYQNYKTLAALIAALNTESSNPDKDHVYQINFYKDYTLTAEDMAALKTLNRTDITKLTFSTVNQVTPDMLSEANTNSPKLTTLTAASGVTAFELPATADVLKGEGKAAAFESFAFGGINTVYGNGCNVNYGFQGAVNNGDGSVRMGTVDASGNAVIPADPASQNFTIYTGGTADVAASPVVNLYNGVYNTVNLGGSGATVTNSTVNLYGNASVSTMTGGDKSTGTSLAVVKETNTLNNATKLDELKTEASLTLKNTLDLASGGSTDGVLYIGSNTTVELQSTTATLKAGALSAESSAKLYIPKTGTSTTDTSGTTNPLIVAGGYTQVSGSKLGVDVKETGMRAQGDHLIRFTAASPGKAQFISTSMGIEENNTYAGTQQVILYGPPANPRARLWLVGEADPVKNTNAPLTKNLYIDTFVFDTVNNVSNDAASPVSDVYILTREQYDAYTANPGTFDWSAAIAHSSTIAAQGVNDGTNGTLANDGVGDGTHTHYYFELNNVTIDETKEYYAAAKSGTGQTQSIAAFPIDVNAPVAASETELTKAATLSADQTTYSLTINLNEFAGLAEASNIRRYGWSTTPKFGDSVNVTAPDRSIMGRSYSTKGSWSTVFDAGKYQELSTAAASQAVTMSVPAGASMPTNLYLYVQDDMGNTRELVLTPQWGEKAISFDLNGGKWSDNTTSLRTASINDSGTIINSDTVWPANPTQDGKVFVGWWSVTAPANLNDTGSVRYYKNYAPYTDGTVLHAVWVDNTDANSDGVPDAFQLKLTYSPSPAAGGSLSVSTAGQTALAGTGTSTGKYGKDDATGVITEYLNRGALTYTGLNDLYVTNIANWDTAATADQTTASIKQSLSAATLTADMIPTAAASAGSSFYGWTPSAPAAGSVTSNTDFTAQFTAVTPTGVYLGGSGISIVAAIALLGIGAALVTGLVVILKKPRHKKQPRHIA
jgi:hypothetical protein